VRHRLLVLLLALVALAGPAAARGDDTITLAPDANTAVAYNTTDNSSLFEFAFAIRHVMSDVVDQQNVAVAWSKCNSCQTTAIAIEIVLVQSDSPSTVTPQNVAIAVNESCTLCDTFASAYQFVVGTDGPVRLTGRGMSELRHIRKEIERWADQKYTNAQIRDQLLPDVIARIQHILATELRPLRNHHDDQDDENTSTNQHDSQPNAPPATTATTETGPVQTTTTVPATTDPGTTTTVPTTTDAGTTTTTTTAPTTTTTP
jgi:putative peptide zinc metalloprotease protein